MNQKPFSRKDLPEAVRQQLSEEWVTGELQHRALLDTARAEKHRDARRHKRLGEFAVIAALAGAAAYAWHSGGSDARDVVINCLMIAGVFGIPLAVIVFVAGGAARFEEGKRFYLYNLGAAAKAVLTEVQEVRNRRLRVVEYLRCRYTFEAPAGQAHSCEERVYIYDLHREERGKLEAGGEVQVLYHPDYPALNTIRLAKLAERHALKSIAGKDLISK